MSPGPRPALVDPDRHLRRAGLPPTPLSLAPGLQLDVQQATPEPQRTLCVIGGKLDQRHVRPAGSPFCNSSRQRSRRDLRGLGRVDELRQHLDEAMRLVDLREVARLLEDLQPARRHPLVHGIRMRDRDDAVALAPDDQERRLLREVEPVVRADPLARWDRRSSAACARTRPARRCPTTTSGRGPSRRCRCESAVPGDRRSGPRRGRHRAAARSPAAAARTPLPAASPCAAAGSPRDPSPPLSISTSRSHRSGNWYASCIATPPPSECPTNVARSCPKAISRSRTPLA